MQLKSGHKENKSTVKKKRVKRSFRKVLKKFMERLVINGRGDEKIINPKVPYPDKKGVIYDYKRTTKFLKEAQTIMSEARVGQTEATWIPQLDFPTRPFGILLMSDIHYGHVGTNYELLDKHFDLVENTPNLFLATNGDHIDNFNPVKHATGMMDNPIPPHIQARVLFQRLLELDKKGKVASLAQGNHDDFGQLGGQDFYDTFMREFGAPIFSQGGVLTIDTAGYKYRLVHNHTYWGRSKINITNAPKRLLEYEGAGEGDIGWVGHTHQSSYEHFNKGGKDLLAVVSGTYKQNDPWAAKNGISGHAGEPGIVLMLWPDKRKMEAIKDVEMAAGILTMSKG